MEVVYAGELLPLSFSKSLFLAGPMPRSVDVASWRPTALKILEAQGYDGAVFIPEDRSGAPRDSYDNQIEWEHSALDLADCILFWVPREMKTMPGLTTNVEFGLYANSGRAVLGSPASAEKVLYLKKLADKFCISQADTLEKTVELALALIGTGFLRTGGERYIPSIVWKLESFQSWYNAQKKAGNRLDRARLEALVRKGKDLKWIYLWNIWVDIFVTSENRHKHNENVMARPDLSSVVLYHRGRTWLDTIVVLVKEFRSPAATSDGFIWEVPGGSSFKPLADEREVAADEVHEETGLKIDFSRFNKYPVRQMAGTFSSHKSHLFSVMLTYEELTWLLEQKGVVHGIQDGSETGERTCVELKTIREILSENLVDWSNLGMILSVISS